MKYLILTILIWLITFPLPGQDIKQVIVSSQEADEPPTKQGSTIYTIKFGRNGLGDLIAENYQIKNSRRKLSQKIVIESQRIQEYNAWKKANIREFELSQLGVSSQGIESKLKEANLKLSVDSIKEMVIRADSFDFCQSYKMTKTMSTGGYKLEVIVVEKSGDRQTYGFDSNDIGEGKFNLKDYLYVYQVLGNKLPEQFPHYNLFTKQRMEEILVYYLKTIECEGYYYKEFIKKNPDRTPQENRMMKGWNFAEYMEQKSKK